MSDQLNFETRLSAAVKVFAANSNAPVDAARIAATALNASRSAGWRTRLASIVRPQSAGRTWPATRLFVVALVAIVAIGTVSLGVYWQRGQTVGPPAPTATPTPSPLPSTSPLATELPRATAPPAVASPTAVADFPGFPGPPRPIEAGTYDLGPDFPVSISFEVPDGWLSCVNNAGLLCLEGGVGEVNIFDMTNVVADPCDGTERPVLAVGPTVDELVTAISSLPWTAVTPPTDVTVDGFRGKEFEVTTPAAMPCMGPDHPGWLDSEHGGSAIGEAPGSLIRLRIIDVQGTRVVIASSYRPGIASSEELAEINGIIDSVRVQTFDPTSTPTPTVASPTAIANFPMFPGQPRPIEAGTYKLDSYLGPEFPASISFVVPAGWLSCTNNAELLCRDGGGGVVNVDIVTNVFADPCDETTVRDPSFGTTVDDLVTAISSLPWSAVTQPADVTVDGIHGKEFEVTSSATSPCVDMDDFSAWVTTLGRRATVSPGERWRLRILEVQGTRVVIAGSYGPGTIAEIDAIIDSVRIEP